jgi:hypothetical protein
VRTAPTEVLARRYLASQSLEAELEEYLLWRSSIRRLRKDWNDIPGIELLVIYQLDLLGDTGNARPPTSKSLGLKLQKVCQARSARGSHKQDLDRRKRPYDRLIEV